MLLPKADITAAREDVKKKGLKNILPIKVNNYAKYGMADLSDDFDRSSTEFKIRIGSAAGQFNSC